MLPFVFHDLHLSTSPLEKPTCQITALRSALTSETSPVPLSLVASDSRALLGEICILGFLSQQCCMMLHNGKQDLPKILDA